VRKTGRLNGEESAHILQILILILLRKKLILLWFFNTPLCLFQKVTYRDPTFKNIKIEGRKAVIAFNNIDNGLSIASNAGDIKGFTIAGEDHIFY
jgi:hypothetical protein